jgi:hypothetical protein
MTSTVRFVVTVALVWALFICWVAIANAAPLGCPVRVNMDNARLALVLLLAGIILVALRPRRP